jgi:hypothetical protein
MSPEIFVSHVLRSRNFSVCLGPALTTSVETVKKVKLRIQICKNINFNDFVMLTPSPNWKATQGCVGCYSFASHRGVKSHGNLRKHVA